MTTRYFLVICFLLTNPTLFSQITVESNREFAELRSDSIRKANWSLFHSDSFHSIYTDAKNDLVRLSIGRNVLFLYVRNEFQNTIKHIKSAPNLIIYRYSKWTLRDGPQAKTEVQVSLVFKNGVFQFIDQTDIIDIVDDSPSYHGHLVTFNFVGNDIYRTTFNYYDTFIKPYFNIDKFDYVSKRYVETFSDESSELKISTNRFEDSEVYCRVNSERIRVRKTPSITSEILGYVGTADDFLITDIYPVEQTIDNEKNFWFKVKIGDIEGYIWGKYILREKYEY